MEEGQDPERKAGPFCAVWVYTASPDAFERAARFALQNTGYDIEVVLIFTEEGARLMQTDRMAQLLRSTILADLVDSLVEHNVFFELDIGSARRMGVVETLGSAIPTLRVANEGRLADLTTGARITARY